MSNINVNNITPLTGVTGTVSVSGSLLVSGSITANGNIILGDSAADSISFGAEVSSSILPDADNTYNLGSSVKEWKDLYIDGTANIDTLAGVNLATLSTASISTVSSSLIPHVDNTYDLGSSTKEWRDLYIDGTAHIDTLSVTAGITAVSGTFSYLSGSSPIIVASDMIPDLDNIHDLGSSTKEWKDLYIDGTAHIDTISNGNATAVNITTASISFVSSSLTPIASNKEDLGSSTREWKDLYIDGTGYIDTFDNVNTTHVTASGNISSSGTVTAEHFYSSDDIEAAGTVQGEHLYSTDDIEAAGTVQAEHLYSTDDATITDRLTVGTIVNVNTYSVTASVAVSCSGTVTGEHLYSSDDAVIQDSLTAGRVTSTGNAILGSTISNNHTINGNISASGNFTASNILTIDNIKATSLTLDVAITRATNTDASFYTLNTKRGEIRSQLQDAVAVDTGWTLELRNNRIAATSLIVANIIGGHGGIVTGSVVSANTVAASTASFNFYNAGAAQINNNAAFTASFAVL